MCTRLFNPKNPIKIKSIVGAPKTYCPAAASFLPQLPLFSSSRRLLFPFFLFFFFLFFLHPQEKKVIKEREKGPGERGKRQTREEVRVLEKKETSGEW